MRIAMNRNGFIKVALMLTIAGEVQSQSIVPVLNQTNSISLITNGGGGPATGANVWGYAFGDYAFVYHGDSAGRGTSMQYKGLGAQTGTKYQNAIEIRRAYLGFNYTINEKFSAYAVLDYQGDYDVNNNRTVYLKFIYFKWKNIFKGSDLKIGQQATNSWANAYNTEALMGYRCIEKTIMDMHKVDVSADMGIALDGKLWTNKHDDSARVPSFIGYSAMIGDNSGNVPVPVFTGARTPPNSTTDKDKKFRLNAFLNTLNGSLTVGAYADYINYGGVAYKTSKLYQNATSTFKVYAAYNTITFGFGIECFMQNNTNGEIETYASAPVKNDTVTASQAGISVFAHATIIADKLNVFARYDMYKPDAIYQYTPGEIYTSWLQPGATWSETFISAGLDWTPVNDKKVHFMPNIWYYGIKNGYGSDFLKNDNYIIYRLSFLYSFK